MVKRLTIWLIVVLVWILALQLVGRAQAPVIEPDQVVGGTLATNGAIVQLPITGRGSGSIQIDTGSMCTCTVQFEAVIQNEWFALPAFAVGSSTSVTSATAAGRWIFGAAGYRAIRVRVSAYTSGTATVGIRVSAGTQVMSGAGGGGGGTTIITDGTAPTEANVTGGSLEVTCTSGCASPPATPDDTAFTAGVTNVTTIAGVFDNSLANLTSGRFGAPRLTENRSLHVNLRDITGTDATIFDFTNSNPIASALVDPDGTQIDTGGGPINAQSNGLSVKSLSGINDLGGAYSNLNSTWPISGVFDDAIGAVSSGFFGAGRITANRALHVNLRNASGTEISPATDRTTAAGPFSTRLSDGASFYDARAIRALTFAGDAVNVSGSTVAPVYTDTTATGTITSTTCPGTGCVSTTVDGRSTVGVQITGTYVADLVFEGTVNGTDWTDTYWTDTDSSNVAGVSDLTGIFMAPVAGLASIRVRATGYTSGTATIAYEKSPLPSTVWVANGNLSTVTNVTNLVTVQSPFADSSLFGFGSSRINNAGYVVDDTSPNTVAENNAGTPRMSSNRVPYSIIRDAAGNERGANVTAANALVVDGSAVTQPVSGTVNIGTFPDNEPINVAQFGGNAVVTGTGAAGSGIPRVTPSWDNIEATATGSSAVTSYTIALAGQNGAGGEFRPSGWSGTWILEYSTDNATTFAGAIGIVNGVQYHFGAFGVLTLAASSTLQDFHLVVGTAWTHVRLRVATSTAGTYSVRIGGSQLTSPLAVGALSTVADGTASISPSTVNNYFTTTVGGMVRTTVPTATPAGSARSNTTDPYGTQFIRQDHLNRIHCTVLSTATTLTAFGGSCAAPGANLSLYISTISAGSSVAGAVGADAHLTIKYGTGGTCGTGTTTIWRTATFANAQVSYNLIPPIKIPANNEICWIMSTAATKWWNIEGFIAP